MKKTLIDFSGNSIAITRLREQVFKQQSYSQALLILGEAGSGKKRCARMLFEHGPLSEKPFYRVDCTDAQFPFPDLKKIQEEGGFVLFEEIGSAKPAFQDRCWNWLRDLGPDSANRRIVSTSSVALGPLVALKRFRPDLYLKLRVHTLEVPALRSRREDFPFLIREIVHEGPARKTEDPKIFTAEAVDWMMNFPWPGNVAQFQAELRRAIATTLGTHVPKESLNPELLWNPDQPEQMQVCDQRPLGERLREYERLEILQALRDVNGYRDRAADLLGIDRRTLQRKLKSFGLTQAICETTS